MAQAKYTVLIPQKDNLGNDLGDVATAAHHWMFYGPGPKVEGSYIHRSLEGNWRDDPQEKMDHLVTVADDTPEMDSTVKQLAAHVGDACNQWGVFVMKEGGKGGVQSWTISNPNFQADQPSQLAVKPEQAYPRPAEQVYKGLGDLMNDESRPKAASAYPW